MKLDRNNKNAVRPMAIARELYRKHVEPVERVTFEERVAEYFGTYGCFVISTPLIFAMGTLAYLEDGRKAWFLDTCVGPMKELAKMIPLYPLPYVVFRRRAKTNGETVKVCRTSLLLKLGRNGHFPAPITKGDTNGS